MSEKFDIAVVGGGAAGIAAAVCAARAGRTTLLLDKNNSAGGTGGFSGLTTLCGFFDDSGYFLNDGFAREFAETISETTPVKDGAILGVRLIARKNFVMFPKIFCRRTKIANDLGHAARKCHCRKRPDCFSSTDFEVGAVIDCSGSAEIARKIGIECLETDEATQAATVIFPLHNVAREMLKSAAAAQVLLPLARAGFPPVNFQSNLEPNSVTVKFTGQPEQVPPLIEFLRAKISGFENCFTPLKEFSVARRAGRMILGEYVLTGADVLAGRKFSDAVARCAWPVEQWNADGKTRLRYLPPGAHYEIPARSLRAAKIKNLFMAGKTISADVDAIASARVMGCCLATGAATGKLAANYLDCANQK